MLFTKAFLYVTLSLNAKLLEYGVFSLFNTFVNLFQVSF